MYHRWLDRWDERRAERSDGVKPLSPFKLDTHLAFPGKAQAEDIAGFCKAADQALNDPLFFKRSTDSCDAVERDGSWLSFPSEIQTDVDPNNIVRARVTDGGTRERALVMFHHWNATSRQDVIANFFSKRGITVVEIAMPYHFERSRPGALHAEDMLSANLGRTVQSVRQAVLDGQQLICWLRNEGFGEISVLGMSLGSWVAGLVAAHDPRVSKAALFLAAGSLADMVWTGRATHMVRKGLETHIALPDLRRAWGPLNLENHVKKLARPDFDLQVILAMRDTVVSPELSKSFLDKVTAAELRKDLLWLNCGHYSFAMLPYALRAGWRLKALLSK